MESSVFFILMRILRKRDGRRSRRSWLLVFREETAHQHEEHRHEEDTEEGCRQHPAQHADTDGVLATRTCAAGDRQWQHAQTESNRGHQNRTQTQTHRVQSGVQQGHPRILHFLGKLDDQNRILRRQTHHGQQANLEVDVVRQAEQRGADNGADHAQRYYQQHREWNRPAFIQRSQAQEHDQQRQRIQLRRLGTGFALFQRDAGPAEAYARRQLSDHFFHRIHRGTRTLTRRRRTQDFNRGQAVVAFQAWRSIDPLASSKGRERHHVAGGIAHEPLVQVFRLHARIRLTLDIHFLHTAAVEEVVHVSTTPAYAEHAVDIGDLQAQSGGFLLVDVDLVLRRIFLAVRTHAHHHRVLCSHAQQLVTRSDQRIVAHAALILQLQVETGGVTQFQHGWRGKRKDQRILDLQQLAHGATGHGRRLQILVGTQFPVFQAHEGNTRVLAVTTKAEASHGKYRSDCIFFIVHEVVFHLLDHTQGALLRGAGRQLDLRKQDALVFFRQEGGRQAQEDKDQA